MTSKEFTLPDVGEGIAEAELVRWLVEPGEEVAEDQPIAEVETDKAVVEVPSPYTGVVDELRAVQGEVVPVGDVLITIRVGEADLEGGVPDSEGTVDGREQRSGPAARTTDSDANDRVGSPEGERGERGRPIAPPSVRRFAREHDVDLAALVPGRSATRLTKADVRAAIDSSAEPTESGQTEPVADRTERPSGDASDPLSADSSDTVSAPAAGRTLTLARPNTRRIARENGVDIDDVPTETRRDGAAYVSESQVLRYAEGESPPTASTNSGRATAATSEDGAPAAATAEPPRTDAEIERRPYEGVRRTIGERLSQSKFTAPHVSHHDTATVEELVATRAQLSDTVEGRGASLTYLPFVLKAVVAALKRHPILNSRLDEEAAEIRLLREYHIGIAVATDAGLLVPVVEDVDEKGIASLAEEIADLAERARSRELTPDEMSGGTFTVTNFGVIGGEYGTPIINYPETAILGLGAIDERAVVEDGDVVARPTLPLSLSFDHRVIDGADAAEFTNAVMAFLEQPQLLLVED
ncbi:dihydrolipoamide acetyltransferase family protein [Natronorubrum texcoconense]|uniref:Pyruvate dehydrogenase E2 component (Dihydrolipoamide acetyltransferase) n=1 Tax=Natronorubrum texcoconense TaxID=1095776 RepID=A0A1G9D0V5_9EURY|nr:dihydrolipoamide acetyltransferase family protein [Natronorubrum texcoconense]SDK57295.1 pyruvate dehydrogenase E2 component (dihydrolipoamide acetyltransferase) [Natronorubrum texcoconense]